MSIGVFLIRASDEQIAYVNSQFGTKFGYGVDELLGQPISIVNIFTLTGPLVIADPITTEIEQAGI